MSKIAVIGRFSPWPSGQYPDEAYLSDALEALGCRVIRVLQEVPLTPLKEAEWVIFTGYPTSIAKLDAFRKTHKTVVWTLDWIQGRESHGYILDAARKADLFVSSDQFNWNSLGVKNHKYLPGARESVSVTFNPDPTISCAFMGLVYNERRKRIVKIVKSLGGVVLDSPGSWLYGGKLSKFVQTVKVVIGDNFRNDVEGYWSTRNYIVPGAGGFLLTPRVPGLELQFKLDDEIAVYDSADEPEEKLVSWIKNDARRESVRRAGHLRTRFEHHWRGRALELLSHLKDPAL